MKRKNVTKNNRKRERREHTNALMDMIQENPGFVDYIARNHPIDETRMELLRNILLSWECGGKEEEIYLYGSLIRGEDLMARQIFLWLLGMAEEMKQSMREECM